MARERRGEVKGRIGRGRKKEDYPSNWGLCIWAVDEGREEKEEKGEEGRWPLARHFFHLKHWLQGSRRGCQDHL